VPDDDLCRVIVDAQRERENEIEKLKFVCTLEDHKKGVYPNCEDDNTKPTLELLQWKTDNGVADKGFQKLLKIMKKNLPKDNEYIARHYLRSKEGSMPSRIGGAEDTCMP